MTFIEFALMLSELAPIVLIGAFFLGCYYIKHLDNVHKSLLVYLSLMLFVELAVRVLKYTVGNNLAMLPIFSLIEMSFFVYFYNKLLLVKPSKVLIGMSILGGVYIIIEIFQYFRFNILDVKQFQPYCKVVDNFIIILLALVFFYQKIKSFNEIKWDYFKLNVTILVYFTFNTIIFLPLNFMVNESSGVKFYFWIGNITLMLLFYIYLTSLIWKNGRLKSTRHTL